MNKKGFVLIETIVVLVIVIICMLGLYKAYSFVFQNTKQNKYYDNINDIYKINVLKRTFMEGYPSSENNNIEGGYIIVNSGNCSDAGMSEDCTALMNAFEIDYVIYTVETINDILNNSISTTSYALKPTDINYMKFLENNHSYLIIHYEKNEKDYYASLSIKEINNE